MRREVVDIFLKVVKMVVSSYGRKFYKNVLTFLISFVSETLIRWSMEIV